VSKSDDSSLDPDQRRAVEERARRLLDRASAWDRFPTPVDDILEAAKLQVAPSGVFDPANIIAYVKGRAIDAGRLIKSTISTVFGIYDATERLIHIDHTVNESKQRFLKLHETGHDDIPWHRKIYRLFQECEKTLAPEIADQFDREANNFARFALFQDDAYARIAADHALRIKTPMDLAKKFGASLYASAREFARTNHRSCVVYVLEKLRYVDGYGAQAAVRRIETSPSFEAQFGHPADSLITLDHVLGPVLPLGRKMTRPQPLAIEDLNGVLRECVAEAFDTTHNVLILLYPVHALTASTIILPPGFKQANSVKAPRNPQRSTE